MNDYTKNLLTDTAIGIAAFAIIAVIFALCFRSCSDNKQSASKSKSVMSQPIGIDVSDVYIYHDRNGVYHADPHCVTLSYGCYIEPSQKEYTPYGVIRERKPNPKYSNWYEFAENHLLCTECFNNDAIEELEEHDKKYKEGAVGNEE